MHVVEPLRTLDEIEGMKGVLSQNYHGERDLFMFSFAVNTGFRIGDLRELRPMDLLEKVRGRYKVRDRIVVNEEKTAKSRYVPLNKAARGAVRRYLRSFDGYEGDPLLLSQKPSPEGEGKAISRQRAYEILNQAAEALGISRAIGTHTMRKTFAFWSLKRGARIEAVMHILNHSSPQVTLHYAGLESGEIEGIYHGLNL